MMMRIIFMAVAIAFCGVTSVQAGCDRARTQWDTNECAAQVLKTVDKKLNKIYKQIMAAMDDQMHKRALRNAQRAWIAYRDRACQSYGLTAEGGQMQLMLISSCQRQLTEERIKLLKYQLGSY